MNFKSVCMPMKPKLNNSGFKILPLVTNVVGDILDCETVLTFNVLHGFKDNHVTMDDYIKELNNIDITYDRVVMDKDFVEQAKQNIVNFYEKGLVEIEDKDVISCECGVVNTTKENIDKISKMKLAHFENGIVVCEKCGKECKSRVQKVLVLKTKKINLGTIQIFPDNLTKEINDLLSTYKDTNILISKTRNTGVKLMIEGNVFNIDVDMVWSQYLSFYNQTSIVTVGSSHVLYAMVLSYIMERAINSTNNVIFLAVPYLKNLKDDVDLFNELKDNTLKKLMTLFCCKWGNKQCYFSQEVFDKLNQFSQNEIHDSYEIMTKYSDGRKNQPLEHENEYKYFSRLIKYGTNFQKNLKYLKSGVYKP